MLSGEGAVCFCEIRQAVESGDNEFLTIIPEKDYNYWKRECEPYPDPDDPAHRPPGYKLPELCTFKLIEDEDGGWRREGHCCQCGECCKISMRHMLDPIKRVCRYLSEVS